MQAPRKRTFHFYSPGVVRRSYPTAYRTVLYAVVTLQRGTCRAGTVVWPEVAAYTASGNSLIKNYLRRKLKIQHSAIVVVESTVFNLDLNAKLIAIGCEMKKALVL